MDKIGICGAGLIGASWAIGFANAGFKCFVYDANQNSFEKFKKTSNKLIQDLRIINPNIDEVRINSNIKLNCNLEEIWCVWINYGITIDHQYLVVMYLIGFKYLEQMISLPRYGHLIPTIYCLIPN